MSRFIYLVFCVLCLGVAASQATLRFKRASSSSSSNSGSYSSSGAGSTGGSGGGFNFPNQNFGFPPFGNNYGGNFGGNFGNPGFPPFPDFNILYQQFLSNFQAAQSYAAANPSYAPIFHQQLQSLIQQQQAAMAQFPTLFSGVDSNTITPDVRGGGSPSSGSGSVYTGASVNYGPQGGQGQAASFPGGADGLGVRIAEELPAPSGGSFGVFTSSSSGTSDVNGKRTSFKTSTFGTNDNGKITFRTINE